MKELIAQSGKKLRDNVQTRLSGKTIEFPADKIQGLHRDERSKHWTPTTLNYSICKRIFDESKTPKLKFLAALSLVKLLSLSNKTPTTVHPQTFLSDMVKEDTITIDEYKVISNEMSVKENDEDIVKIEKPKSDSNGNNGSNGSNDALMFLPELMNQYSNNRRSKRVSIKRSKSSKRNTIKRSKRNTIKRSKRISINSSTRNKQTS